MSFSLRISPCPNDTFVFYALINRRIEVGFEFDVDFFDIEQLNLLALSGGADIVKASAAIADRIDYRLLDSGAALGFGVGPMLVSRPVVGELRSVALPGENTTATQLFRRYFASPSITIKYMLFSDIASAVASGDVDGGVLIHEGRFTYQDLGLQLVEDMGSRWEAEMEMPLPLGAIYTSKKSISDTQSAVIEDTIRRSVEWAFKNRHDQRLSQFIADHARELSPEVQQQHIECFVNQYTISLGVDGRRAIELLNDVGRSTL